MAQSALDKKFIQFVDFLSEFIQELNLVSRDGDVLLVEGVRDARAMRRVGYRGPILTISSINKGDSKSRLAASKRVIILTDLDREGRQLAARYAKSLTHRGVAISLLYRRRLLAASRGVFRHVENLERFAYVLGPDGG
jgi:5S rRNA maturation endonuclease (ribonuclease M5)